MSVAIEMFAVGEVFATTEPPSLHRSRALSPKFYQRRALAITAALACITMTYGLVGPRLLHAQRVQPLDPLTPEEEAGAVRLARADGRVLEALGPGRTVLIRVQFLALKSGDSRTHRDPAQLRIGRNAAVLFYRPDTDTGIHVVVDLQRGMVGEITRVEGQAVPLAREEIEQAFRVAMLDERVRAFLGAGAEEFEVGGRVGREGSTHRVEGLRIIAPTPEDPCFGHRCLDLLFRTPRGYLAGLRVTVDLTAGTVRSERSAR